MAYLMRVACDDWSRNEDNAAAYSQVADRWLRDAAAGRQAQMNADAASDFGDFGEEDFCQVSGKVSNCYLYREEAIQRLRTGLEAAEGGASSAASADQIIGVLSRGLNILDVRKTKQQSIDESGEDVSTVEFVISSPRGETTFFSFNLTRNWVTYGATDIWTFTAQPVPNSDAGIRSLLPTKTDYLAVASQQTSTDKFLVALDTFSTQRAKPECFVRKNNLRKAQKDAQMSILKVHCNDGIEESRTAPPSPQQLAAFIKSIGLDKDCVKPNDVLLSLLAIAGCTNWNKPPAEEDWSYFDTTDLPLWLRDDDEPPTRISWENDGD